MKVNDKKTHAARIKKIMITGDTCDEVIYDGTDQYIRSGKDAVKITIEIDTNCAEEEVLEVLKTVFQKTIQSFQQFFQEPLQE